MLSLQLEFRFNYTLCIFSGAVKMQKFSSFVSSRCHAAGIDLSKFSTKSGSEKTGMNKNRSGPDQTLPKLSELGNRICSWFCFKVENEEKEKEEGEDGSRCQYFVI